MKKDYELGLLWLIDKNTTTMAMNMDKPQLFNMSSNEKGNKDTVQRRETSVPVGEVGGRTGPHRPSASDCSTPLVGCQAGVQATATGRKEEMKKPFNLTLDLKALKKGSGTPGGTPTGSGATTPNTPGGNVSVLDLAWDDEGCKSVEVNIGREKRDEREATEKEERAGKGKLAEKIIRIIKEIDMETRSMSKVVRDNANTKKEIKESTVKLRSLMSQIMTKDVQELIRETSKERKDKSHKVKETLKKRHNVQM